jgi:hypothetical protein
MITPIHSLPRAKRRSRRRGKSHGRQGLPNSDWNGGPVPYLESLHAEYSQKIENLDQKLRIIEGQSITSTEEDTADKRAIDYRITQNETERSLYEAQLEKLLSGREGEQNQNPSGKAARHRHIPATLYVIALISLAVGEYFVTLPAVELLLGDADWKAWIITLSFAALSILGAHIIGLTAKLEIDRDNPQPVLQKWGILVILGFLTLVILLLSALRSGTVSGVPFKFGIENDLVFGTILFFFIQMTFIVCAIALSYFNHSEYESNISRTKRRIKRLTNEIRNLTRSRMIPNRGNLTPEKRVVQVKAIVTNMRLLEAEYRELCAVYRGSNLLAQKVSFTTPGTGLTESSLKVPESRIIGEIE